MSRHPEPKSSVPHYELRVRGRLGPTLMSAFPGLTASRVGEDTVLTGDIADQSALYGLVHQIEALGLELLEVRGAAPTSDAPHT